MQDNFIDPAYGIGIRRLKQEDIESYHEAALSSAPEAYQFMPWCHPAYSVPEAEQFITSQIELWEQNKSFGFSIYDLHTDELIGAVEIAYPNFEQKYADLGYWMRTSSLGKGYTTAASRLAVRFAFEELKLSYLRVYCLPENMSSRRIAVKLGARFHSKIENFIFLEGKGRSAIYYELLAKNFSKTKN
jgi:ribosomal-protein-serine acetyltransferase